MMSGDGEVGFGAVEFAIGEVEVSVSEFGFDAEGLAEAVLGGIEPTE